MSWLWEINRTIILCQIRRVTSYASFLNISTRFLVFTGGDLHEESVG